MVQRRTEIRRTADFFLPSAAILLQFCSFSGGYVVVVMVVDNAKTGTHQSSQHDRIVVIYKKSAEVIRVAI